MTETLLPSRYAKLSMTLHWLMLALFVGVYACIELKGLLPRGHALRSALLGGHALFGIGIFLLVWLRLLGRLMPRPPQNKKPSAKKANGAEPQVWVLNEGQPQAIAVKVGASNGRQTEITDGDLKAGMAVITDYQETKK